MACDLAGSPAFPEASAQDEFLSAFALASWRIPDPKFCVAGHDIAEELDKRSIVLLFAVEP